MMNLVRSTISSAARPVVVVVSGNTGTKLGDTSAGAARNRLRQFKHGACHCAGLCWEIVGGSTVVTVMRLCPPPGQPAPAPSLGYVALHHGSHQL